VLVLRLGIRMAYVRNRLAFGILDFRNNEPESDQSVVQEQLRVPCFPAIKDLFICLFNSSIRARRAASHDITVFAWSKMHTK